MNANLDVGSVFLGWYAVTSMRVALTAQPVIATGDRCGLGGWWSQFETIFHSRQAEALTAGPRSGHIIRFKIPAM